MEDFSLVLGGPLYRLWRRTRLLAPDLELLKRRIAAVTVLAWLPLVPLAWHSRNIVEGVAVPFLFDLDTHVRLLVVLPLLIAAEIFVHTRLRAVVRQFVDRGLVVSEERERFEKIAASTIRLRNSVWAEILILVVVATAGHWLWWSRISLEVATWYAANTGNGLGLTPAGYWYAFVSIPVFQFLLLRWYYRTALWCRLLWKTARLNLRLIVTHPDEAGGLGFLGWSVYAFAPLLSAHTILLAGMIGNRIWHESASLLDFRLEIVGIVVLLLALAFLPLTVFTPQLLRAKRKGMIEFDALAERYVRGFDAKWIRGGATEKEALLGSTDIQSLADLAGSQRVIRIMWAVPFWKETVFRLALLLAAPFLPLVPTVIPLERIFSKLVNAVL